MTGFGTAETTFQEKKIHVEIRSLNGKNLDLTTRVAPIYREKEIELRQIVTKALERGKIDCFLRVETQASVGVTLNEHAVSAYLNQIEAISQKLNLPQPRESLWELLVRLPEVTQPAPTEELSPEEWNAARHTVEQALEQLIDFRKQEGAALEKTFREKIKNIADLLHEIQPYEKARVDKIRARLQERLAELNGIDYDRNRLEQELIYYIEKLDISEEKQRLTNHLNYFVETLETGHAQGKKLGFIAQEMGREINTTGSKSNIAEMQNLVVRMKDELEQIKEQVLNVL